VNALGDTVGEVARAALDFVGFAALVDGANLTGLPLLDIGEIPIVSAFQADVLLVKLDEFLWI